MLLDRKIIKSMFLIVLIDKVEQNVVQLRLSVILFWFAVGNTSMPPFSPYLASPYINIETGVLSS